MRCGSHSEKSVVVTHIRYTADYRHMSTLAGNLSVCFFKLETSPFCPYNEFYNALCVKLTELSLKIGMGTIFQADHELF